MTNTADHAERMIMIDGLTKRYGDIVAVDNLTLSIRKGEVFGLLGPNGAGKSTTILMLLGLTEPTSGRARMNNLDPVRQPLEVKRRIGYLPDDVGFYDDMSGLDNLIYTARLNGIEDAEAHIRAEQLLERVGLQEARNRKAGTYSRGMRQRLGLADVLIKQPEIIILDEPTLGIDPSGVRELLELIRSLSRDEQMTVLLSSHQLHQVQEVCDRVGIFVKGRLIAEGDVESLSQQLFHNNHVQLRLKADPMEERLITNLSELDQVMHLRQLEGGEVQITCLQDLSAQIAQVVLSAGASLEHLSKRNYGLDEIYARYFEGGN